MEHFLKENAAIALHCIANFIHWELAEEQYNHRHEAQRDEMLSLSLDLHYVCLLKLFLQWQW